MSRDVITLKLVHIELFLGIFYFSYLLHIHFFIFSRIAPHFLLHVPLLGLFPPHHMYGMNLECCTLLFVMFVIFILNITNQYDVVSFINLHYITLMYSNYAHGVLMPFV